MLQQQGREDLGQWGQRRSWPGIYRGPCSGEVPSKKMIRPECLICGCWARSCGHKLTHLILKHAPKCFPSICRLYLEGVSWWHPLGNGDCVCAKTETGCWESLATQGWRGFGVPHPDGGPHFQLLKKLSLEVDQNHVSKALDPSRGLAEHAAAAFSGVSLDQEGEVEAWLLEQSPGFLPSV